MLKSVSTLALSAVTSLALFSAATTAQADTFKLYTVANTQSEGFVMGDDFGNYAINSSLNVGYSNLCGTSFLDVCYQVGNAITGAYSYSSTIPAPLSGGQPGKSGSIPSGPEWIVLNHLGSLFSGFYRFADGHELRGIWSGTDPVADFLSNGSLDGGLVSGSGNVYFIDGLDNTLVAAIDVTTSPVPEPGTLSLTATAVAAAAAFGRRRLRARPQ